MAQIMGQKPRQDAILDILRREGYVSVAYLTNELHYSTATINRDLNQLAQRGLVRRNYGGVELTEQHEVKLPFRYHKMRAEKRLIAQAAAALVYSRETPFSWTAAPPPRRWRPIWRALSG